MKPYKRAFLYITRKKNRSIILFFIMWVCVLSILVAGTVWNQTSFAVGQLKEKLSGYFTIMPNREVENSSEQLTDEFCRDVMKEENILAYNGNDVYYMNVPDLVLTSGMFSGQGAEDEAQVTRFISCTNSFYSEQFYTGEIELIEGEHLQGEDEGKALVSETLAKENHLQIGDTFTSRVTEGNQGLNDAALGEIFEHQIKGIYRTNISNDTSGNDGNAECNIPDNFIFVDAKTDYKVMTKLRGEEVDWYRYGVNFFVRDSANFEQTLKKILEDITLPSESYRIEQNNGKYEQSAEPIEKLTQIMSAFIISVLVLSSLILYLILAMWMKDRRREIGIYLEVGIEKKSIFIQLLIESVWIYLVAFGLAIPCAVVVIKNINHRLWGNEILEVAGMKATLIFSVFVIEALLIGLSVILSYINVVKMNPKDILSSNE